MHFLQIENQGPKKPKHVLQYNLPQPPLKAYLGWHWIQGKLGDDDPGETLLPVQIFHDHLLSQSPHAHPPWPVFSLRIQLFHCVPTFCLCTRDTIQSHRYSL